MTSVRLNEAAILALGHEMPEFLDRVGERVAERAAKAAPKRTGAGARSIHSEVVGNEAHVSWDNDHFYMTYVELGTSKMAARPFLRPALHGRYEV